MKEFVPLHLTQPIIDGEDPPRDLGWKDLGPLRVLDVTRNNGDVAMEIGCGNAHVKLVTDNHGGISVYRNNVELVEST